MNVKLRKQLRKRKRRLTKRIDKTRWPGVGPVLNPPSTRYELAEKQQAVSCGGLGAITEMVKQLKLRQAIDRRVNVFKINLPYTESDHVLNIAYNLLAGGTCLDHLETRRTDEAYLNALDAQRIPGSSTAGDFCRRFSSFQTLLFFQAINDVREQVWKQQPEEFFDTATIEADGTMVETKGEKKEGVGLSYKGTWGYHPLVVTLHETQEVLYLINRSGNRPSHEHAWFYLDLAIERCRKAGFRQIVLRGDTDFSQTEHLDRWDSGGVKFVFGIDAMPNLVQIAENLAKPAWKMLRRGEKKPLKTAPRKKRPNHKEAFVVAKGYKNKKLKREWTAEFDYQPTACDRSHRVVVVRKKIETSCGQKLLFDEHQYFFYITNFSKDEEPREAIVRSSNARCDQENSISQLKACHALAAPLDNLESNGAYMAIASLAWTLKCWCALMIRPQGGKNKCAAESATKHRLLRMEFATFRTQVMDYPAQIIRRSRSLVYRLLTYRPSIEILLTIHSHVRRPLRC